MRYVILGAGAVGGALGATLHRGGHDVTFIARGENLDVLSTKGLRVSTPQSDDTIDVHAAGSVSNANVGPNDAVIVAVKGQDTLSVLRELGAVAPSTVKVVCAQNGLENERVALRLFPNVYAMCVITPATHLEAGHVVVHAAPEPGVFDLGRWPGSVDDAAAEIARDITQSGAISIARADIATLKWGKLLSNILNALEALTGDVSRGGDLSKMVRDEAVAALSAAGVDTEAATTAIRARFGLLNAGEVAAARRSGGSSWQSLARGSGDIEADFLNGEIVLAGRLHHVPTPANELLQRRANDAARRRLPPGSVTAEELLGELAGS